jgi:hypothetical protein
MTAHVYSPSFCSAESGDDKFKNRHLILKCSFEDTPNISRPGECTLQSPVKCHHCDFFIQIHANLI